MFVFLVGVNVVEVIMILCSVFYVKFFVGLGKVEEIVVVVKVYDVNVVIFNYVFFFF